MADALKEQAKNSLGSVSGLAAGFGVGGGAHFTLGKDLLDVKLRGFYLGIEDYPLAYSALPGHNLCVDINLQRLWADVSIPRSLSDPEVVSLPRLQTNALERRSLSCSDQPIWLFLFREGGTPKPPPWSAAANNDKEHITSARLPGGEPQLRAYLSIFDGYGGFDSISFECGDSFAAPFLGASEKGSPCATVKDPSDRGRLLLAARILEAGRKFL